jgi:isopentenyldiphosphate isomerase
MEKPEILDIIDEIDNVIGQATREECHSNPNIMHRTVHFVVVDKENKKVLLTRRSIHKNHDGGKITFLGEHVLSGESYEQGLKRGVKEELGIDVSEYKMVADHIFSYQTEKELVRCFVAFYNGSDIHFDRDEIEDIQWVDIKDIKNWKDKVSDMTRYWIENIDWEKVL